MTVHGHPGWPDADRPAPRRFDGIICFGGEDWWYHNRGHFDIRLMQEFSTSMPVLYVNSIGMRTPRPREGRMFLARIRRKLRSIRRGLVPVSDGFAVLSPIVLPGRAGLALTRPFLTRTVRSAARRRGITRPLVWVACPTAVDAVAALDPAAVIYQRTDRYEDFKGVDADRIRNYDRRLKTRADLTLFCSTVLFEQEAGDCRCACYVDHGLDLARFETAAKGETPELGEIDNLPRPRIGFVGGIDDHTFDAGLFLDVARRLPAAHFVLVGACSLRSGWCDLPNVSLLGQRAYEEIPRYLAAFDVLIMPWNRSPWIEACNPVKLKEYLASGRPIVSTDFAELRHYKGLVRVASNAETFAEAIRWALREPGDAAPRRDRVRDEAWSSKARIILSKLAAPGAATRGLVQFASKRSGRLNRPRSRKSECAAGGRYGALGTVRQRPARIDLAACIVLAGGLRPSPLASATRRSVLDLWLTPHHTVLDCWLDRFAEIAAGMPAPIRVAHDSILPPPCPSARLRDRVIIERDPQAIRGPVGVVADLCTAYAPNQHVVVVEAARYLSASLQPMLLEHVERQADISVAANPDGSPAGIYVIRCGALDLVPAAGFMDLKEQWLCKAVDAALNVRVHWFPGPGALALRTCRQFLAAARVANDALGGPIARGSGGLRVICPGVLIGPGATVVDSIVMPGAIVGANAVVARSLLCPHARVEQEADVVEAVVVATARAGQEGPLTFGGKRGRRGGKRAA